MEKDKYGKYISLLEANKNLILTGAPGTGKTYLAKEIAKAMGAKYEFVQFHPSYDYTDFVEGLRPVPTDKDGRIGFERKDGIFKAFCKKALNIDNMDESSSRSFEYFYYELVDDIRSRKVVTIKLRKQPSLPLHISDSKIIRWTNANGGESSNMVSLNRLSKLHEVYKTVADIDSMTNINDAIRKVIGGANASYYWGVLREVLSRKEAYEYDKKGDLFETLYQSIINDIKSGRISSYRSPKGALAPLRVNDNNRIEYRPKDKSPKCEKEDNIKLMFNYLSQNKIYDLKLYKRKDYEDLISKLTYGETKTLDYVEYGWILQELLNRIPKSVRNGDANISKDSSPTKYIFIIDEINRGEISKIFGELFFSIDPGYRGMEGRVKTQYQNLITDESDPFFDGFYVPDNVYIIGTMNDIDRSVESMDFAMRRRFAWEEIMANDNIDMLDELKELKDDVVGKMRNLNAAIESIEGLNSSYHIGAAYFRKLTSYLNKDNTNLQEAYKSLWDNHLRGVLSEYLRGSMNMMENLKNLEEKYNKANESVKSEG